VRRGGCDLAGVTGRCLTKKLLKKVGEASVAKAGLGGCGPQRSPLGRDHPGHILQRAKGGQRVKGKLDPVCPRREERKKRPSEQKSGGDARISGGMGDRFCR